MHILTDDEDCGEGRGLVIRPEIIFYLVLELIVVVIPHTDIDHEEIASVSFLKILCHVVNRIPVGLL